MIKTVMMLMQREGLNDANSGNASYLYNDGFYISRTGDVEQDPLWVAFAAIQEGNLPDDLSSEWRMHEALYRKRPDVGAIIHFHGRPWINDHIIVAPGDAGTQKLAEQVSDAMIYTDHVYIADHGNVVVGEGMLGLYYRLEQGEWR